MPNSPRYDVAVVGAGVFGAWTAYQLAQSGQSVVLLEAYGPAHSRASSGGETRIIRMGYGPDELYTRWSVRALRMWQEFSGRSGQPLFHRTGVLWMARKNDPRAAQTEATLARVGVRYERYARRELEEKFPQISFDGVAWGLFEPDSGALMARRAVQSVVEAAVSLGVQYRVAAALEPRGKGRLNCLRTSLGEEIPAATFVFACGPWLGKLFPKLLGGRIFPTRQEVFFFGVPPGSGQFSSPALPIWLDPIDEMYGFPDIESRGFKIAHDHHGPAFDPDTGSRVVSERSLARMRKYVAGRFPALARAPLAESRVCQYENTSNGDFLIDRHPAWKNVWLVGGGSGHGFKHGPAVGEYVTARILQGGEVERRFSLATKKKLQRRAIY